MNYQSQMRGKTATTTIMLPLQQIFAERLQLFRKREGLTLRSLAEKMDNIISAQTISNYENGQAWPDSRVMNALVNALHVHVDDLIFAPAFSWQGVGFTYRKRKSLSTLSNDKIEALVRTRAEKYMEIESILALTPNPNFRNLCENMEIHTKDDARAMAMRVRSYLNLGEEPIANLTELLENQGVKLMAIDEDDKFDGVNFICENHSFIVYNTKSKFQHQTSERIRFTIAHELGHLLLNIPDMEEKEEEALCNAFASEVLLPANRLKALVGEHRDGITIAELKRIQASYGISVDAIMHAAAEINIITEKRYKFYNVCKNRDVERKVYIEKSIFPYEPENCRFAALVNRAVAIEAITIHKAAALLGKPYEEVYKNANYL